MSNVLITPLMGLTNPVPGSDPGPDYATNLYNSFNIVDGHNHSVGSGNQINTDGILINADLPFNSNFNATLLRSARFAPQPSVLSLPSDLGCLYESGVDLYFNDGNGNQVRITSGGNVNATSSGISSGNASAAFSGGVLVVDSNTNTPGNIQCGSVLIGNNTVGSNFVTVSAPSSLAANYPLQLPTALPGAQSFLSLDASGNIASYAAVSGGITGSNIASATITASNMAANSIATASIQNNAVTPAKLSALNTATSDFSTLVTSATLPQLVSGGSLSITATGGRPVMIEIIGRAAGSEGIFQVAHPAGQGQGFMRVDYGAATNLMGFQNQLGGASAINNTSGWPLAYSWLVFPGAGSFTVILYIYAATSPAGTTVTISAGTITLTEL